MIHLRSSEEEEGCWEISALRQAALQNDARLLEEMLVQEAYRKVLNCRGGWGVAATPLHAAASRGHAGVLQVLLGHGALVDRVDVKAQTPLFAAVRGKYLDCVLTLLRAGADPDGNPSNNCSPVLSAAREGDAQILRQLLLHGAEVNSRSKVSLWSCGARVSSGPLYLAAVYGHADCFKLLLQFGADPDYNCADARPSGSGRQPRTVLEMCLRHGCGVEYVQLLIDFGANVYLPTLIIEKVHQAERGGGAAAAGARDAEAADVSVPAGRAAVPEEDQPDPEHPAAADAHQPAELPPARRRAVEGSVRFWFC
ncbi:hypothetical protein OJAV_G00234100 [Oryzias javanicus]|uniref:Uncharacterized protein n=1 Tax=Oryzias javanicus TaxID=123683 RepID=A0A437BYV3_ORYJA|nr:hypothetical protein OJAV_G00234100 [Oryzias javanicus]